MKYHATLEIFEDPALLAASFGPELGKVSTDRSSLRFTAKKKSGSFTITANDSVALRATLVGITKLCTVYEHMKLIKDN